MVSSYLLINYCRNGTGARRSGTGRNQCRIAINHHVHIAIAAGKRSRMEEKKKKIVLRSTYDRANWGRETYVCRDEEGARTCRPGVLRCLPVKNGPAPFLSSRAGFEGGDMQRPLPRAAGRDRRLPTRRPGTRFLKITRASYPTDGQNRFLTGTSASEQRECKKIFLS
jgi:hypothetical protein